MKYIITESKLDGLITEYLYRIFDVDSINHNAYEDDYGNPNETAYVFYEGDFDDDNEYFKWYSCDYFRKGSPAKDICPTVSLAKKYSSSLNGYFGNRWHEPFKQWAKKNFGISIKTIDDRI